MFPCPVAYIAELRVDEAFEGPYSSTPFSIDTIVASDSYYRPEEGNSIFNAEIELSPTVSRYRGYRRQGLINPIRRQTRRKARVEYYAGTLTFLPMDLMVALVSLVQELAVTATSSGVFQSESLDYYSYSRMDVEQQKKLPSSAYATLLRYRVLV